MIDFNKLACEYRDELLGNVLPFWLEHSQDKEFGGYFTCLNRDGSVFDTDKFIWLQGREVWLFAMLYNQVERRPEWLDCAVRGAEFLRRYGHDGDYYNVFVDGRQTAVVTATGADTTIVLADSLPKGIHTLLVQKRTEGEQGRTTLYGIESDAPLLAAPEAPARHIEFIGDSHTCGYGTEGLSAEEQFTPQTENCDLAWGCIVARYFGAEYTLIAHSGQGIVRNWGDEKEVSDCTMRERMRRTLDMEESPAWDGSAYRPDIVVIKLGSNDFSTGIAPAEKPFNDSYARAIDYLRSIWGQVPILCVAPSDNTVVLRYLEQLIAERQDANLHFTAILPGVTNWDSDMGANYHPNHHGHRKLAMSVIPYIATITGWELPDTSVE